MSYRWGCVGVGGLLLVVDLFDQSIVLMLFTYMHAAMI
jgi:hypothetical protein